MKCVFAIFLFLALLFLLALALYFYFSITIISIAFIALITIIASMAWACRTHELSEIIDPIRERYKMNTIWSEGLGGHKNIEDAARKNGQDIRVMNNLVNGSSEKFRKMGFIDSLPEWIVKQAIPFLFASAPKWIIAIIIGVIIIRFHEDIIPHGKEKQNQLISNEITLRIKMSGDTNKGDKNGNSVIDIGDYCLSAQSKSNVITLSDDGCN